LPPTEQGLPDIERYFHERLEVVGSLPLGLSNTKFSDPTAGDTSTDAGIGDLSGGCVVQLRKKEDKFPQVTATFCASSKGPRASTAAKFPVRPANRSA
jgi:hypothetical protein